MDPKRQINLLEESGLSDAIEQNLQNNLALSAEKESALQESAGKYLSTQKSKSSERKSIGSERKSKGSSKKRKSTEKKLLSTEKKLMSTDKKLMSTDKKLMSVG